MHYTLFILYINVYSKSLSLQIPEEPLLSSKQTTTDMTLSLPNFEHFVYDRTYDKLEVIKVDASWKQQYLEKLDSHNNSRVA